MLKPITCKYCGREIKPPTPIIGEPDMLRQLKTVQKMARHIASRSMEEQQAVSGARARREPDPPAPHAIAAMQINMAVQGITNYAIAGHFELSEELQASHELGRHSIHEATRAVRMTDEDLEARIEAEGIVRHTIWNYLRDLRDEYESLGIHAPAPLAPTSAPKPELVKP